MKNNTHLTPAQWLLVAGGASAVIGTAVFIFDERIGNSAIRYFMERSVARATASEDASLLLQ